MITCLTALISNILLQFFVILHNELLFAEVEYMQKREVDLHNHNQYLRAKDEIKKLLFFGQELEADLLVTHDKQHGPTWLLGRAGKRSTNVDGVGSTSASID